MIRCIRFPRSRAPFGEYQESGPLGTSSLPGMRKLHAHRICFVFSANQIVNHDSEHMQSDGKFVNRRLPVFFPEIVILCTGQKEGFCLFSFSNVTTGFHGFHLKKLKRIQLIFELVRGRNLVVNNKDNRVSTARSYRSDSCTLEI